MHDIHGNPKIGDIIIDGRKWNGKLNYKKVKLSKKDVAAYDKIFSEIREAKHSNKLSDKEQQFLKQLGIPDSYLEKPATKQSRLSKAIDRLKGLNPANRGKLVINKTKAKTPPPVPPRPTQAAINDAKKRAGWNIS